jgi:hypothetical protein
MSKKLKVKPKVLASMISNIVDEYCRLSGKDSIGCIEVEIPGAYLMELANRKCREVYMDRVIRCFTQYGILEAIYEHDYVDEGESDEDSDFDEVLVKVIVIKRYTPAPLIDTNGMEVTLEVISEEAGADLPVVEEAKKRGKRNG